LFPKLYTALNFCLKTKNIESLKKGLIEVLNLTSAQKFILLKIYALVAIHENRLKVSSSMLMEHLLYAPTLGGECNVCGMTLN
jgi:hypothetical protein